MMRGIFTVLLCIASAQLFGQVDGDYRSRNTGAWTGASTWQIYNAGSWGNTSTPPNSSNGVITIRSPHNVTVSSNIVIDQTVVDAGGTLTAGAIVNVVNGTGVDLTINGTLQINNGGTVRNQTIPSTTPAFHIYGTVNNAGTFSNGNRITFQSTAVYNHDNSAIPGSIPPTSTWVSGSICRIRGDLSGTPGGLNQNFANFEWNTPGFSGDIISLDGALTSVAGNLSIANTGAGILALDLESSYTLNIGGNLSVGSAAQLAFTGDGNATINVGADFNNQASQLYSSAGDGNVTISVASSVNFSGGTFDAGMLAGTTSLNVAGNYTNSGTAIVKSESPATSGMNLTFTGSGNHDFVSTLIPSAAINYAVNDTGNLDIAATSRLAGSGTFTVASGASVTLRSVAPQGAYRTSVAQGNVQVTGTRSIAGTMIYAGSALQRINGQTPDVNTIIANAAHVRLNSDVTFTTGTLTLATGNLQVQNFTLTVGEVDANGGNIQVNTNSSLVLNGTGVFGDIAGNNPGGVIPLSGTAINNLTINQTGANGAVAKTGALTIRTLLDLESGVFNLGAGSTTVNGNFAANTGSIVGGGGNLVFSALAALPNPTMPAGVSITGTLSLLNMTRSGTLNLTDDTENLDVTRLNLYLGNVNSAGGLRMASGGSIYRTNGFLTSPIGAVGVYNVQYTNFSAPSITTGLEIPTSPSTALSAMTIYNTSNPNGVVIMDKPIVAAATIRVRSGYLQTNHFDVTTGANFRVDATGALTPGRSTFTFNGAGNQSYTTVTRTGFTPYRIMNIVVNKTGGNFSLASPVNIRHSFAINSSTTVALGNNRLTLLSKADTTAYIPAVTAGATITGRAIVQRFLPNARGSRQYRYISVPTVASTGANATTVSDLQNELPISGNFSNPSSGIFNGVRIRSENPSLFYFNEPTGAYIPYPNNVSQPSTAFTLARGRGYSVFGRTNSTILYDLHGRPNYGDVTVAVTNTGSSAFPGYNLIGNPYACPIDWEAVYASNNGGPIFNSIYFIDNNFAIGESGTVTYVGGVSTPAGFNGQIASGQGFFVRANGGGNVTFQESHKSPGQATFIRKGEIPNVLQITMKHKETVDYAAVRVADEATDGFDGNLDAYKFDASALSISTLSKGAKDTLAINSVSRSLCEGSIPVYISGAAVGNYTLEFSGFESFESGITPVLFDKVENKVIEIADAPKYSFAVSNASSLRDRFELRFNVPLLETALEVKGATTCKDNSTAIVTLPFSQADVQYTAMLNGLPLSSAVAGTGNQIEIPVSVANLPQGDTEVTIFAKRGTCDSQMLAQKAVITMLDKPSVSSVKAGEVCGEGSAVLVAAGSETGTYNWYETSSDIAPIAGQNGAEFTTPSLIKSKTYYVAAVNAAGCEGERIEVKANVTEVAQATIAANGFVLTSNYDAGNQWYLDGVSIEGATGKTLEAVASGLYTVTVTSGTCTTTSAGREMVITGVEDPANSFIRIYPNPSPDVVNIEVRYSGDVAVDLVTSTGVGLQSANLPGSQDLKTTSFNLTSLPEGMYLARIKAGTKVFTKKILKSK